MKRIVDGHPEQEESRQNQTKGDLQRRPLSSGPSPVDQSASVAFNFKPAMRVLILRGGRIHRSNFCRGARGAPFPRPLSLLHHPL